MFVQHLGCACDRTGDQRQGLGAAPGYAPDFTGPVAPFVGPLPDDATAAVDEHKRQSLGDVALIVSLFTALLTVMKR